MEARPPNVVREAMRLLQPFWPLALFAALAGTVGGLATAWLLATVNRGLTGANEDIWPLLGGFVGLGVVSVSGTATAGALNSIIGQRIIAALRKEISARILRAPIAAIESYRSHRLIATLTNDVDTVSAFTFNFSAYAIALAVTLGSFLYLLMLSRLVFVLAVASLAVGAGINIVAKRSWIRDYEGVRTAQDDLHKQYRAIIDGAKELKISRERRGRVHGVLLSGAADRIADLKSRAMRQFWVADAAGSAVFFAAVGLLLAARHWFGIGTSEISGAVIVLLYVKGPVEQLASALPVFDQARISFNRIAALSAELDQHEPNLAIAPRTDALPPRRSVNCIELHAVRYDFPGKSDVVPFVLGPIDLAIRAGELVFIVGENGSGKTTLIKLLLGLYEPHGGEILLDGAPLTAESRDDYRQLFTTIFADYYLFDDLAYGALPEQALRYLTRLEIAHKVTVKDGVFSTTDLSSGQRKRLALLHAYLEQRPVIVTDEWAADQDPAFRRVFYIELLPELKRQGKTLIVVSHDDRYFDVADRIIRMAEGRIVEDRRVARPTLVGRGAT